MNDNHKFVPGDSMIIFSEEVTRFLGYLDKRFYTLPRVQCYMVSSTYMNYNKTQNKYISINYRPTEKVKRISISKGSDYVEVQPTLFYIRIDDTGIKLVDENAHVMLEWEKDSDIHVSLILDSMIVLMKRTIDRIYGESLVLSKLK